MPFCWKKTAKMVRSTPASASIENKIVQTIISYTQQGVWDERGEGMGTVYEYRQSF